MFLSQFGYAPIPFWLDMPITQLQMWIKTHNEIFEESHKE